MSELESIQTATAIDYSAAKPALLFCNDPGRKVAAAARLAAAGVRLVNALPLIEAEARLDGQVSLGLVWLELGEGDGGPVLERLLPRLNQLAESRGVIVIASVPLSLVDLAAAALIDRATEILVDPDDAQRAATLAMALSGALAETGVSDVGKDNAARLRQLSDEMARIASTLARLSTGPGTPALKPSDAAPAASGRGRRRPRRHPCPPPAGPLLLRGTVRRSVLGHAARPAPGRNRPAARPGVVAVHRRRGAGDNRTAMDQDDDRARHVRPPRRSP